MKKKISLLAVVGLLALAALAGCANLSVGLGGKSEPASSSPPVPRY